MGVAKSGERVLLHAFEDSGRATPYVSDEP